GYAMLVGDDGIELSKLYVLPEHHGTGVATALMDAALQAASELGGRRVWLGVNKRNQRAQRFYANHGFRVNGTRTFRV
ncbi:GNAT family N-acetyltransferase, partial [Mycobacterium celatum]